MKKKKKEEAVCEKQHRCQEHVTHTHEMHCTSKQTLPSFTSNEEFYSQHGILKTDGKCFSNHMLKFDVPSHKATNGEIILRMKIVIVL